MWRTALRVSCLILRGPSSIYRPVRFPFLPPAAKQQQQCVRREYSSQRARVVLVTIPSPSITMAIKVNVLLIRAFLDKDFSLEEFKEGARQAFLTVSRLLSQKKFDALENLVAKEVLKDLEEKCSGLSDDHRKALTVESDEFLTLSLEKVCVSYDKNEKSFVNILVRFWYLKNADLWGEETDVIEVHGMLKGFWKEKGTRRSSTADYEFCREYSPGVKPEWIIKHIEHSKFIVVN